MISVKIVGIGAVAGKKRTSIPYGKQPSPLMEYSGMRYNLRKKKTPPSEGGVFFDFGFGSNFVQNVCGRGFGFNRSRKAYG